MFFLENLSLIDVLAIDRLQFLIFSTDIILFVHTLFFLKKKKFEKDDQRKKQGARRIQWKNSIVARFITDLPTLRGLKGMKNIGINFVFPTIEKLSFMVAFVLLFSFFRLWEIRFARFHHNYKHKTKAKSGSCVLNPTRRNNRIGQNRELLSNRSRDPFPIDRVRSLRLIISRAVVNRETGSLKEILFTAMSQLFPQICEIESELLGGIAVFWQSRNAHAVKSNRALT